MQCRICPHDCRVDRSIRPGICQASDRPKVALAGLHHWEEPCLSGTRGSGTIFFSHCNLACVFCQNFDISQEHRGREVSPARLAEIAFGLRDQGAHNVNLVSPTPYTEMIIEALGPVRADLGMPIVWNSNGYELAAVVRRLEPLVDVYLPDLKFVSSEVSKRFCGAADYFEFASAALREMYRQRPAAQFDKDGLMIQGLVIRHLILPGYADDSRQVLRWIADNIGTEVHISLMAQYTPVHRAREFADVNRRLRRQEYEEVCGFFYGLGFENGWVQELSSASSDFTPDFDLKGT
jgi:putative pyruvate formate lyase activating enzyme